MYQVRVELLVMFSGLLPCLPSFHKIALILALIRSKAESNCTFSLFCWRPGTWQRGRSEQPVAFVSLLPLRLLVGWAAYMGAPGISCYTPLVASCSTGGLVGIAFCVPDLLNVSVTTSHSLPLRLCWSLSISLSLMHPFCSSIPLTDILLFLHSQLWHML